MSLRAIDKHAVNVAIRVRPLLKATASQRDDGIDEQHDDVSVSEDGHVKVGSEEFSFASRVICGSDQHLAFDALGDNLVQRVLDGYCCSLVAYGQTGSGKTYTVFGPTGSLTEASVDDAVGEVPQCWGVLPRALLSLLSTSAVEKLYVSAVEIYQDMVFDLLSNRKPLQISNSRSGDVVITAPVTAGHFSGTVHPSSCCCRECFTRRDKAKANKRPASAHKPRERDSDSTFALIGETLQNVSDAKEVARFARHIEATRTAKGHALNDRSSRSHCIVRVHCIVRTSGSGQQLEKRVKRQLLFVDLAGSERIAKSLSDGIRAKEATNINRSLSALQRVVHAITTHSKHVPYRDSVLTMLLRDSFAGNSITSVVINVASEREHKEETISSLRFGEGTSNVKNKPSIREGGSCSSIEGLEATLASLKTQRAVLELEGFGEGFAPGAIPSEVKSLKENMRRKEEIDREVYRLQFAIVEAKGRREDEGSRGMTELQQRIAYAKSQSDNLRDIILRQQTISGLWQRGTPLYKKVLADIRQVEADLLLLRATSAVEPR